MHTAMSLHAFLTKLQQGPLLARPDNEPWKALIERISTPGVIALVGAETYEHFLECLPPKYQHGYLFAFAEGAEEIRLFWRKGLRYFCRQLTWDETTTFCRLAGISLPS